MSLRRSVFEEDSKVVNNGKAVPETEEEWERLSRYTDVPVEELKEAFK